MPKLVWELELELERLRKEQQPPSFEPVPLYLPLEEPPPATPPEPEKEDDARGYWEIAL